MNVFCVEIKSIPCTGELSLKKQAKFLHLFKLISKKGTVNCFPIEICQSFLSKVGVPIINNFKVCYVFSHLSCVLHVTC